LLLNSRPYRVLRILHEFRFVDDWRCAPKWAKRFKQAPMKGSSCHFFCGEPMFVHNRFGIPGLPRRFGIFVVQQVASNIPVIELTDNNRHAKLPPFRLAARPSMTDQHCVSVTVTDTLQCAFGPHG
jgi:hypothetical protein